MNHYQINEDGTGMTVNEQAQSKTLAAISAALNIPVVMTPDTRLEGAQAEAELMERLMIKESRERAMLEVAILEACSWLNSGAPGRAYSTLTDALEAVKQERQA